MDERDVQANRVVERYTLWSGGVGLIPIPFLDMAALTLVNVKMTKELAVTYSIEFREDRAKAVISSLLGGVIGGTLGKSGLVRNVLRAIPLVGQTVATLSFSIFGAASTYAVGRVFTQHFATGGTMLDFEPEKVRHFFSEQYEKGKRIVKGRPAPEATEAV